MVWIVNAEPYTPNGYSDMLIEIGPASLVVEGQKQGKEFAFDRMALEAKIKEILLGIRDLLPLLKQKAYKIRKISHLPSVARRMIAAAKLIDEPTLTPMAAVAGAVSDELKEFLKNEGLDVLSVNNGGDISIFSGKGRPLRIALGDIESAQATPYVLSVASLEAYGIATSGFGGRSMTLGLADMVTVVAQDGATADAAATFICNATNVESMSVMRKRGSEIHPDTDIPDDLVTVAIGRLSGGEISCALHEGMMTASKLKDGSVIYDALILLRGQMVTTINGGENIMLEVFHGN